MVTLAVAPQRLSKASRRSATPIRAPQRLSKAGRRSATPIRALQGVSVRILE